MSKNFGQGGYFGYPNHHYNHPHPPISTTTPRDQPYSHNVWNNTVGMNSPWTQTNPNPNPYPQYPGLGFPNQPTASSITQPISPVTQVLPPPVAEPSKEERRAQRQLVKEQRRSNKLAQYDDHVQKRAQRRAVKAVRREERAKKRQSKKENEELQELMDKLLDKAANNPSSEKQQRIRELAALITAVSSSSSSSSSSDSDDSDLDDDIWLQEQLLKRAELARSNVPSSQPTSKSKSRWFNPFGTNNRQGNELSRPCPEQVDSRPQPINPSGNQWAQIFSNPDALNRLVKDMVAFIVLSAQSVQTNVESGVQSGVKSIQKFDREFVTPATDHITPCLQNLQDSIKKQQPNLDQLLKNIQETFQQAAVNESSTPTSTKQPSASSLSSINPQTPSKVQQQRQQQQPPLEEASAVADVQPQRLLPNEMATQFMKAFTDALNIALPMASSAASNMVDTANRALGLSPQSGPVSTAPLAQSQSPPPPSQLPEQEKEQHPPVPPVPTTEIPNFDEMGQDSFTEYMLRQIESELIAVSTQQQQQQQQQPNGKLASSQSPSALATPMQPTTQSNALIGDIANESLTASVETDLSLPEKTAFGWDLVADDVPPHLASVLQSSQSLFQVQAQKPQSVSGSASTQAQTQTQILPPQPDANESYFSTQFTPILDRDPVITIVELPHQSIPANKTTDVTLPFETQQLAQPSAPVFEEPSAPLAPPQTETSSSFTPTRIVAASKEAEFESLFTHSDELYKQRQLIVTTYKRLDAEGKGPQDGRLRLLNEHLRKIDLMIEKTQASIQQLIGDAEFDAELEQLGLSMNQ